MGLITWGILGGFRKKTGAVVGAFYRGQDVIRAIPRSSTKSRTQAQQMQRSKFGLVTKYLSRFSSIIDTGYPNAGKRTKMNEAVAYHLRAAVTGTFPDYEMDHSKLFFSHGAREFAFDAKAVALPNLEVEFNWKHEGNDRKNMSANDTVTVVVYDPETEICITAESFVKRSAKKAVLQLPSMLLGNEVYCYLSVNSESKPTVSSETQFLGKVIVVM
ncbi:DUF6266 family protein [Pedobacter steynii]|uniref:Uncharacterized protein n=1 Tax=Pedobacter steynii TaxID=430522 RepID=A0A1D7QFF7_9SPHI|nr:DUF6266 family protein [Pedobacter steynii]AOM77400.1 hypothetical protein BFS30_09610 [Pedobacter steynii]